MLGIFSDTIYMFVLPTLFLVVAIFRFCEYVNERKAVLLYLFVLLAVLGCIAFLLHGSWDSFYIWLRAGRLTGDGVFFVALFLFCVFMFSCAVYYFTFVQFRVLLLFALLFFNPILLRFRHATVHPVATALLITLLLFLVAKNKIKAFLPVAVPIFAVTLLVGGVFARHGGAFDTPDIGDTGASPRTLNFSRYSRPSREGSDEILFLVEADEPLYFVTQVFGKFDGTRWHGVFERPFSAGFYNWEDFFEAAHMNTFLEIMRAQEIADLPDFTESVAAARIIHQDVNTRFVLAPPRTFRVEGMPHGVNYIKNTSDEIFIAQSSTQRTLYGDSDFTVYYFRDVFRRTPALQELSARFCIDEWIEIVGNWGMIPPWEYEMGLFAFMLRLENELIHTRDFMEFAGVYDNPRIAALAMQLTEGLATDYEKAVALENHFRGFTYSLDIAPHDVEYFLFEGQTGACVEFATAMTLMARAVGLNARYVEGFVAHEQNDDGQFVIRGRHGHAFVQIYFAPYGWVTFEPTQGQLHAQSQAGFGGIFNMDIFTDNILTVFLFLSIACAVGFAVYLLYVYVLAEKLFRRKARNAENSRAVILLFKQISRLVEAATGSSNLSAMQLADLVQTRYGVDLYAVTAYYERAMYNDEALCQKSKDDVYSAYLRLYSLIK